MQDCCSRTLLMTVVCEWGRWSFEAGGRHRVHRVGGFAMQERGKKPDLLGPVKQTNSRFVLQRTQRWQIKGCLQLIIAMWGQVIICSWLSREQKRWDVAQIICQSWCIHLRKLPPAPSYKVCVHRTLISWNILNHNKSSWGLAQSSCDSWGPTGCVCM